jgi:hypothetical protein
MLSTKQLNTLHATIDRIIPPDDYPGGWEAGVGDYLLRQFERDLKAVVDLYRTALDALDAEAQVIYGQDFAALDADSQDALLTHIEQGQVSSQWSVNPADFLKMLVNHAMEGFYSDPGNGGNRDGISWKMIGFEVTG